MKAKAATRKIVAEHLRGLAEGGISKADAIRLTGLSAPTVYQYAKDFGIEFKLGHKGFAGNRGPRSQGVREACIAGRGKLSARQIALKLGISRDAVIGHWFRARQAGLIT